MRESLSIIMPVRDRQATIESRTETLLEMLSELSSDVQVILVDDSSTDATPEILDDLRRRYPQITIKRNARSLGPAESVEMALPAARGEFIFLHQSYETVDWEELLQMWQLRRDEQLVVARAATRVRRIDSGLLQRLQNWGRKLEEQWPEQRQGWNGLQMMRRSALKSMAGDPDMAEAMEVTHQSHRRISGPKVLETRQESQTKKGF